MKKFYCDHWRKIHLFGMIFATNVALAQSSIFIPSAPTSMTSFNQVLQRVVTFAAGFVGVIAVLYLIMSGFNYIMAGGNAKKVQAATQGIQNAIIGIVIVVIAVLLVNYVLYNLLDVNATSTTNPTGP